MDDVKNPDCPRLVPMRSPNPTDNLLKINKNSTCNLSF